MSNPLDSVGDAVTNVFDFAGDVFKGIKDVVVKVLPYAAIAAGIYVTGGLAGAWSMPAWLGGAGAATGGATLGTIGQGASALATSAYATGATAGTATGAGFLASMQPGVAGVAAGMAPTTVAGATAPAALAAIGKGAAASGSVLAPAAQAAAGGAATGGAVGGAAAAGAAGAGWGATAGKLLAGAGKFLTEHPILAYGGLLTASQMLSPTPGEDEYEAWKKKREWERRNSTYFGITGTGQGPGPEPMPGILSGAPEVTHPSAAWGFRQPQPTFFQPQIRT